MEASCSRRPSSLSVLLSPIVPPGALSTRAMSDRAPTHTFGHCLALLHRLYSYCSTASTSIHRLLLSCVLSTLYYSISTTTTLDAVKCICAVASRLCMREYNIYLHPQLAFRVFQQLTFSQLRSDFYLKTFHTAFPSS